MRLPVTLMLLLGLAAPLLAASAGPGDGWETFFEASDGLRTPRYAETRDFALRLAEASPLITYATFGTSPRGRDLMLLIADGEGRTDPAAVRAAGNAVLLVQACIHAGESDGKDAGLMLLRDLAIRGEHAGLLDHVTVLFLPIFNVDGHERFGPLNRPNQNGPEEMGWRVTARNLNLNRDYVKADTVEMRDWLALFDAWLPDFFIDCHVSDGADFRYTVMYDLPVHGNMEAGLSAWTRDVYLPALRDGLAADGWPLLQYGGFRSWHDPRSGQNVWISGPRYSHGYTAIRNRPGLLLETHVLKPYAERVAATYDVLLRTLETLDREGEGLRAAVAAADRITASPAFRAEPYPLTFRRVETDSTLMQFLGWDYEFVRSEVTGGRYPVFHRERPLDLEIPVFSKFEPEATADVPEAYLVPPEWTEVVDLLALHGVKVRRLAAETELTTESLRFRDPRWAERPFEGRHRLEDVAWDAVAAPRLWPAGTAVVDLAQPAARAALHLLDPAAPDALLRWGFFDAVFERKEYIESYVLEPLLPGMLEQDPELAAAWEAANAEDPSLHEDYWRSLTWFYERSPWADAAVGRYPVAWTFDRAAVDDLPLAP